MRMVGSGSWIASARPRTSIARGRRIGADEVVDDESGPATVGAALLAGQLLLALHPESQVFSESDFYGQGFYMGALYALTAALALALWSWLGRRLDEAYPALATLFWLGVLAVLLGVALPHASNRPP